MIQYSKDVYLSNDGVGRIVVTVTSQVVYEYLVQRMQQDMGLPFSNRESIGTSGFHGSLTFDGSVDSATFERHMFLFPADMLDGLDP